MEPRCPPVFDGTSIPVAINRWSPLAPGVAESTYGSFSTVCPTDVTAAIAVFNDGGPPPMRSGRSIH